jgi:hypothetical protein
MADLFTPKKMEVVNPADGERFTAQQISAAIGGIGGQIERLDLELDGEDVVVFYRAGALVAAPVNKTAEALFGQEFLGNVLAMPPDQAPQDAAPENP